MTVAMRCTAAAIGALMAAGASALAQGPAWSFDDLPAGQPPAGFVFGGAPADRPAPWVVLREGANAVLAHMRPAGSGAQVAVVESASLTDVMVAARLRFVDDPGAAGLVWRYRDPGNYYVAALNLQAQDVRIYRVAGGNRTRLEDEDDLELDPTAWHTIKVEHRGIRMRVWIDGVPVADARDRAPQEPGAIGVWIGGDVSAWFDDLRAEPLRESQRTIRSN